MTIKTIYEQLKINYCKNLLMYLYVVLKISLMGIKMMQKMYRKTSKAYMKYMKVYKST